MSTIALATDSASSVTSWAAKRYLVKTSIAVRICVYPPDGSNFPTMSTWIMLPGKCSFAATANNGVLSAEIFAGFIW